mgnify:CR=1 FL=1
MPQDLQQPPAECGTVLESLPIQRPARLELRGVELKHGADSEEYRLARQRHDSEAAAAELAELGRLLADPVVRLVTVLGAGGMGKTRLVNDFLEWATLQGADILQGRAFEAGALLPYQPLVMALRGRLEQVFQIGAPDIRNQLNARIRHDQKSLLPLAMIVLLLTLALSLRRLSGALIPLFTAGLSVVMSGTASTRCSSAPTTAVA